jgi:thiamine kinase-like enzyme
MALTVEEAIARVPQWAGAADIQISPLRGGITNQNYRVDTGGESFVLRITGEKTDLLGIERENEYIANRAAGLLGIAPEVIYFIRPEGYLVTRFIQGRPIPPEEIGQKEMMRKVVSTLRKVHSMEPIPSHFSVFRMVENYTNFAHQHQIPLPEDFHWYQQRAQQAKAALKAGSSIIVPCHNDLLNENFLFDGEVRLLDWEYAGMGDPFFDLANFSSHHQFTEDQDLYMLECYFEEVTQAHWTHLKIMKMMSDFREAMWAIVQIGISQLDFDYQGYADTFFRRTAEKLETLRF